MTNSDKNLNRILVTGGCGYVGSQLIRDLARDNRFQELTIRILDNMQEKKYQALMDLPAQGEYDFVEGDILDPAAVDFALQDVDAVIHLAAVVQTPMSFENPTWVEQINHWGTARLVESCLEMGVKKLVYASSAAVYGPGGPFREDSVCRPFGAYAQSKYKGECSVLMASQRGLKPVVLRLGSVFGPAPSVRFDAVANRFAYLAGSNRPLTVFGQGDQVRPFIHVKDASEVIRFCLERLSDDNGEIFNAVGENASVLDLVETVQRIQPDVEVRYTAQDVLTHLSLKVDPGKLLAKGWEAKYSLKDGLGELIAGFSSLKRC
jgi:UDP-glucose 4-epimerase